jgi:DNA-binding CsgD family transcriptional regulator
VDILAPAEQEALEFGDSQLEFFAAVPLADAYVDLGDNAAAEALVSRSVEWQDRSALGRGEYTAIRRARAWLAQGDVAAARAELARLETVLRPVGFDFATAEVLLVTARAAEEQGDLLAARAALEEATALAAKLGFPWYVAWAANTAGRLARAEGRPAAAEEAHHRALIICGEHAYAGRAAEVLECLASLAFEAQSWAEAARLYGAAGALRTTTGQRRPPLETARADADAAALAEALGSGGYAAAIAQGEALSLDEAAAYASRARGERKRPASGWESLTPTERDIVALVAEGLTNADIGQRMFITTGTVKVHLHNVFAKLGISRRSELAAQATERRLTDR